MYNWRWILWCFDTCTRTRHVVHPSVYRWFCWCQIYRGCLNRKGFSSLTIKTGSQINFLCIIANWATEILRLLAQIKKQYPRWKWQGPLGGVGDYSPSPSWNFYEGWYRKKQKKISIEPISANPRIVLCSVVYRRCIARTLV
jgi:hypothetical protein